MFLNTVPLSDSDDTVNVSLIDGPTNQRTTRASADGSMKLSIAHQLTSENGPVETQRSNVRIEISKEIEDTGKTAKGYVQYSQSFPRSVFTAAEAQALASRLVTFLVSESHASIVGNGDLLTVARLYGGEP